VAGWATLWHDMAEGSTLFIFYQHGIQAARCNSRAAATGRTRFGGLATTVSSAAREQRINFLRSKYIARRQQLLLAMVTLASGDLHRADSINDISF